MTGAYLQLMALLAFACAAISARGQLANDQTHGFGANRLVTFTYLQNFDCVDQPRLDLDFNGVPAESDPNEMQVPICQPVTEPTQDPTGGKIDPVADIETIETELMLADLDSLEKRVDNLAKKAKGNDKDAKETLDLVNRALVLLRDGKPARFLERKPEEERAFGMLGLLTSKPVLYVCNVEEGSARDGNSFSKQVFEHAKKEGAVAVVISAKIESEIATLSREERTEFLDTLGLEVDAEAAEIKARFKELVKRHHPDANGGDRSTEDRLVAVIQAYNYLKSAKFC